MCCYLSANFTHFILLSQGYKQKNAFIASQGPVPSSIPDFWRMVWEQATATIVMLTNLEEKGRVSYTMTIICSCLFKQLKSGKYCYNCML